MSTHKTQFQFRIVTDLSALDVLKSEWLISLVAPQDDMWESFTNAATHWEIKAENQIIGYACVNDENRLLQFFVAPNWQQEGPSIFHKFIKEQEIESAMIGTNNPYCLSLAMHFQTSVIVDTYLFTDVLDVELKETDGIFSCVTDQYFEAIVDFYHKNIGAPKSWLNGYLGNLVEKGEVFMLKDTDEILGTCEVRKSESDPRVAGIGMITSAQHRKKGLGSYLLGKAKEKSVEWHRAPICSCEKDNIGSLKSIQNNGFRSTHQMLLLSF